MAFRNKEGKAFGNKFRMSRYDAAHSSNDSAHEQADHGDKSEMPMEGEGGEGGMQSVIAQHGRAHDVHITHDPVSGMHHMHSIHEDGYEHHSDHPDPESAHEDGKIAAGVASDGDGDEDTGEYPMKRKPAKAGQTDHAEPDEDDYEAEEL